MKSLANRVDAAIEYLSRQWGVEDHLVALREVRELLDVMESHVNISAAPEMCVAAGCSNLAAEHPAGYVIPFCTSCLVEALGSGEVTR